MLRIGMLRIRTIGLCLVAAFAMSAVAASSAMAEPGLERGVCKVAKKGLGEYTEALCLTPGAKAGPKKEYVWDPGTKATAFTTKTGVATLRSFTPEGAELPAVECKKSKGKGKTVGTTESTSVVTFEECTSAGEKCTGGPKAKAGDIITFELKGVLGMIVGGSKGGELISGGGPGGLSSEFKCGANEIKTRGSLVGEVLSTNVKASATMTAVFAATGKTQEPESFEGGTKNKLETEINGLGGGTFPFASTEVTTATIKGTSLELRLLI
jgi:hypothetical protein